MPDQAATNEGELSDFPPVGSFYMTVISKNPWRWKGGTQQFFRSSSGTASSPMVSYFRFTAFTPAKCSREYNNVEAWPAERMNLSRFGQIGSSGSNRRNSCHSTYTTGAMAMGGPG